MLKHYIILFLILISNIGIIYSIDNQKRYIAHGGGSIDGWTYTNSLEALNKSYADGFRIFELDIIEDSDGNIIAAHDWIHLKNITGCDSIKEIEICDTITSIVRFDSISYSVLCDTIDIIEGTDSLEIIIKCDTISETIEYDSIVTNLDCRIETTTITEEHFLTHKIYEEYTPMNMERINQWFSEHEDAILVTDKIDKPEKMSSLFVDKSRLMMELFTFEAIEEAKNCGVNFLMSECLLYEKGGEEYLLNNKIPNLAVSRRLLERPYYKDLLKQCKDHNIKVYVFSINFDPGKDEKYVYENEMQYIYGMYADKWIEEFNNELASASISEIKNVEDEIEILYNENILSIKFNDSNNRSVHVYDVSGICIASAEDILGSSISLDIADYQGLCIINIKTVNESYIKKIFIK